jgi:hypothetical protein
MREHHTQPLDAAAPQGDRVAARPDLPSYRTILMEFDRGVATITLNRPRQRNAAGEGMREELADAYRFCDRAAVGARETDIHLAVTRHDDARERVRFLERRPPVWTGSPQDPTCDGVV